MDYKLLNSIMVLNGDSNRDLAKFLNITESQCSRKKRGKNAEFTQKQIRAIKERYHLSAEQVDQIFFTS